MTDDTVILALCGFTVSWCTLLWLALRQPGRGNPRKRKHDQARIEGRH